MSTESLICERTQLCPERLQGRSDTQLDSRDSPDTHRFYLSSQSGHVQPAGQSRILLSPFILESEEPFCIQGLRFVSFERVRSRSCWEGPSRRGKWTRLALRVCA